MPVAEMAPTAGLTDHVTEVLVEFVTVAANASVCDVVSDAEVGVTETVIAGSRVMMALDDLVVS